MNLIKRIGQMCKNPVSGKWKSVYDFLNYTLSGAGFYDIGKEDIHKVMHYEEAIKLSSK